MKIDQQDRIAMRKTNNNKRKLSNKGEKIVNRFIREESAAFRLMTNDII